MATMAMFFVTNVTEVIWCRLLLGVFEAGFFPGMIFYFALWFLKRELADVTAWFFFATAGSAVVGGPFAGWIVGHFDVFGYAGWRWLFILEGTPTVLCGIGALFLLYDSPKDAPWLKPDERAWLINQLAKEQAESTVVKQAGLLQALSSPVLWLLAMVYMCFQAAAQTAQLWFPGVLKGLNFGLTDTEVGFIMALPFLGAMICLTVWGRHSDRTGERKWHTIAAMVLAAVSLLAFLILPALWMKIVTVTLYGVGTYCCYGTYWAIPAMMISPAALALAVSVAFINSCSSLGGFLGAKILGYVQVSFGTPGLFVTMTLMMVIAVLLLAVMRVPREHRA
jgi:MFS family permease